MKGAQISRPPVYRLVIAQCVALLLIYGLLGLKDPVLALSAALGGLILIVPNAWFASRVFRRDSRALAQRTSQRLYAAEVGKFMLSAAGFALVFVMVRPIVGWAVFAGYGVMLVFQVIGASLLVRMAATGKR